MIDHILKFPAAEGSLLLKNAQYSFATLSRKFLYRLNVKSLSFVFIAYLMLDLTIFTCVCYELLVYMRLRRRSDYDVDSSS